MSGKLIVIVFNISEMRLSWFQTFAIFWLLYAFFWVIPRVWILCTYVSEHSVSSIFMTSHSSYLSAYEYRKECSETSAYKIQTSENYPEESLQPCLSLNLAPWKWFFDKLIILHLVKKICLCWNLDPVLSSCNLEIQTTACHFSFKLRCNINSTQPSMAKSLVISSAFFQNSVRISHIPCVLFCNELHLWFVNCNIISRRGNLWNFNPCNLFEFTLKQILSIRLIISLSNAVNHSCYTLRVSSIWRRHN